MAIYTGLGSESVVLRAKSRGTERQLPRHWLGREGGLEELLTDFFPTYIFSHIVRRHSIFHIIHKFLEANSRQKDHLNERKQQLTIRWHQNTARNPSFTHVGIGRRCWTIPATRRLLDKDLYSIQNVCEDDGCRDYVAEREILRSDAPGCAWTVSWIEIWRWLKLLILLINETQYHFSCQGLFEKLTIGWFCFDECKKNVGFRLGRRCM